MGVVREFLWIEVGVEKYRDGSRFMFVVEVIVLIHYIFLEVSLSLLDINQLIWMN